MKKLFDTLVLLLAANFLAVAGLVGWLYKSGHLDRERVQSIKQTLFPPPSSDAPTTQPVIPEIAPPASQRLAELLARHTRHSSAEQVELVQQSFDTTMAQLDRREREVGDRERQVANGLAKLANDRKLLEADRQKLSDQERQADRLASDKGFQDTLNLYNTMSSRQVKSLFMTMDETSAAEYLDAMQPRTAAKIIKEFKGPDETGRMKRILDKMRHPPGATASAAPEPKE